MFLTGGGGPEATPFLNAVGMTLVCEGGGGGGKEELDMLLEVVLCGGGGGGPNGGLKFDGAFDTCIGILGAFDLIVCIRSPELERVGIVDTGGGGGG